VVVPFLKVQPGFNPAAHWPAGQVLQPRNCPSSIGEIVFSPVSRSGNEY